MNPAPRLFDAHLHIIDSAYPLVANHGYLPDEFTIADYRARTDDLGVAGGAVVSGAGASAGGAAGASRAGSSAGGFTVSLSGWGAAGAGGATSRGGSGAA